MNNYENAVLILRRELLDKGHPEEYVDSQVEMLFNPVGYKSRFDFFMPLLDQVDLERVLISGASAGGEIQSALDAGAGFIDATEVSDFYIRICETLMTNTLKVKLTKVKGEEIPFDSESFSLVISGHIIEHTSNPKNYLQEHARVLRPGGYLFLEFPTRFSIIELHTGRRSVEWLPLWLRKRVLKILILLFTKRGMLDISQNYKEILGTLVPVSALEIRFWLKCSGANFLLVKKEKPSKGIVRLLFRKK